MREPSSRAEHVLTGVVAVLMVVQSAGGLLLPGLYRGNAHQLSGLPGNDLVTLLVAVPLLLVAARLAARGSLRGRLLHLGALGYAFYNNMYYLFGLPLHRLFLVYEALMVVSAMALVLGLTRLPAARVAQAFGPGTPRRLTAGYLLLCAAILSAIWIGESLRNVVTGSVPGMVTDMQWLVSLPAVFDLALIVTPYTLGAIWLWSARPWGYVTACVGLVLGSLYPLVLLAVAPFEAAAGLPGALDQVPLWAALGAGCLLFTVWMLRSLEQEPRAASARQAA